MDETPGDDSDPTSPPPTVDALRWSRLLSFLSVVGAALSTVAAPDEAIEILLRHGLAGVEADGAALTVRQDRQDRQLQVIGAAGYARVLRDRPVLDLDVHTPLVVAARDGTPVWVTDRTDAERRFPASLRLVPDAQAFAAVPLVLDGAVIGSFGATFASPREFGEVDRWFLRTLADFAARWIGAHPDASDAAPMVLVEHDPDSITEISADFGARVALVAEALTTEMLPFELVEIVVRQAMAALGAEGGTVALLEADQTLLPMLTVGYGRSRVQGYGKLTLDRVMPLTVAARRSEAVWVESFAEALRRFPALAEGPTSSQAWAAVPLLDNGRAFAVLGISFTTPHTFSPPERAFLKTLGHLAALRLRG